MARVDAFQEYQALQQIHAIVPHVSDDVVVATYRQSYDIQRTIEALLSLDDTEDVQLNEVCASVAVSVSVSGFAALFAVSERHCGCADAPCETCLCVPSQPQPTPQVNPEMQRDEAIALAMQVDDHWGGLVQINTSIRGMHHPAPLDGTTLQPPVHRRKNMAMSALTVPLAPATGYGWGTARCITSASLCMRSTIPHNTHTAGQRASGQRRHPDARVGIHPHQHHHRTPPLPLHQHLLPLVQPRPIRIRFGGRQLEAAEL